eukprot:gene22419-29028_t
MYLQENGIVRTVCILFIISLSIFECLVSIWTHREVETVEIRKGNTDDHNADYRWWLFVTVILSVPAVIERIFDSLKSVQTKKGVVETLMRSCKVLTLVVPNIGLLFALATKIFSIKKYDAVFGPQEVVVIATILSSTFGNSVFYGLEGIEQLMISVEQSTLSLLATYMIQRSITLVLMAFDLKSSGYYYLIVGSTCLTILSLAWVVYVTVRVSVELGRHMIDYQFFNYHQMHDFCRMVAVVLYISYNVVVCVRFGGEFSGYSYYTLESRTAIAILVGQVGLIILLILIDSRSLLRRAELTEDKLQVRLDLVRYLSHEMRSPLNTAFMGLQLIYHDAISVLAYLNALAPTLANLVDVQDGDGYGINSMLDPLSKMQAIIETNILVQESSHLALETLNDMLTFDKLGEKKLVLELKDVDVWSFVRETVRPFAINATMRSTAISMRCVDEASMWTDNSHGESVRTGVRLVELHGGIIGAKSEGENTGSTFFFEFPLYDRPLIDGSQPPVDEQPPHKIHHPATTEEKAGAPGTWLQRIARAWKTVLVGGWGEGCEERHGNSHLDGVAIALPAKLSALLPPLPLVVSYEHLVQLPHAAKDIAAPISVCGSVPTSRRLSFLIADDSAMSRKVTKRLLILHGHEVEEASDGLDFLRKMG